METIKRKKDIGLTLMVVVVGVCASFGLDLGLALVWLDAPAFGAAMVALTALAVAVCVRWLRSEWRVLVVTMAAGILLPVVYVAYVAHQLGPKAW